MLQRLMRRSFLALSIIGTGVVFGHKWLHQPTHAGIDNSNSAIAIQSGGVTDNSAIIWARGDRDSRLVVDYSPSPNFRWGVYTAFGPNISADTDYTGTVNLFGLRPNTTYYYRVRFVQGHGNRPDNTLQGLVGCLQTAPTAEQPCPVRFVWAADMAGQGWGRNPNLKITAFDGEKIQGGYVIFDVMRKLRPNFALFSGDMIYADNPIPATKEIPASVGGGIWVNQPAKDFVAITLDEFRGNWKYNLGDAKFARFLAETPVYVQWDDHVVTNNWYPNEILITSPYNGIAASTLAQRARQAFFEYNPIRGEETYRHYSYGKHLELFLLDERSFRSDNGKNTHPSFEILRQEQLHWIKQRLKASRATWKVIASDNPLSIFTGTAGDYDAWSQNDSRVLGREAQLADLLKFIKDEGIKNVVWITADVHFPAAISYAPNRAVFQDFEPFWEFVTGPIHAGAFGPAGDLPLDPSFGPQYEFNVFPSEANLPPPHNQFFGSIDIDIQTANFTASIHDVTGKVAYKKILTPR